jgi:superfamily II DNA or RNA helicase
MAELVADLYRDNLIEHGRILVIADKLELIKQLQFGFWNQLPKWIPTHILSGEEKPTFWDGIVFATDKSVLNLKDSLPPFGLILVDEAHHIGSRTCQSVIDALRPPMLGGVTATPWRGDEVDIEQILGQPLVRIGIAEGLRKKFLAEVDYRLLADNLDWNFVQRRSVNRYSLAQLNKQLLIPTRDDEAARLIAQVFRDEGRRGGIVFSSGAVHAFQFAGLLRSCGLRAEAISSYQDPRERDKLMARFRKGDIDIVTSVDLFNEGVDVPDVDLVAFMRVTHSRRIFIQQIGRGLRISPNKDKVIVLDFVSDLRRMAEILTLERAARDGDIERLPLGSNIVRFREATAGNFMMEWLKDQADLMLREGDASLELPLYDFPTAPQPGGIQ